MTDFIVPEMLLDQMKDEKRHLELIGKSQEFLEGFSEAMKIVEIALRAEVERRTGRYYE